MPAVAEYIDQSPAELRLTLVEGELDLAVFNVLDEQAANLAGVRIEARIIGASHIITYHAEGVRLHEIFACAGPEGVSSWRLAELEHSPVGRCLPGFRYGFSARSVVWSDPEPGVLVSMTRLAESADQSDGTLRLVRHFPRGDSCVTPKTVVLVSSHDDRRITAVTAHSYPNVRGLVLSRSTLQRT